MKLVGASNWFVRGPFMLEGLFTGLIGAILAVIVLFIGKETVVSSIWFKDRGSARARVPSERPDPDRARAAARRGRVHAHAAPLPEGLTDLVVVELARRGKHVVGEPVFTPGVPLLVDRKGLGDAEPVISPLYAGAWTSTLERVLGRVDDVEAVLEGLLVERGLREGFEPYDPPAPSLEGRADLRDLLTFTIDPETAEDFDDALSVRQEEDGLRAWVHIADVSHFVPAGSPLDRGADGRAFSTYVPGRVAPMLPHELADDLCSLRPHVDRLP